MELAPMYNNIIANDRYKHENDKLTIRENALAIMAGEQPDYYFDLVDSFSIVPDPDFKLNTIARDGKEHSDRWGVVKVWRPDAPGAHPVSDPDKFVINDICNWRKQLELPDIENLDWSAAQEFAAAIDRAAKFVTLFMPAGLFERSHFLMGMEEAFCAYLEEPEAMKDLLTAIANWKIRYIEIASEKIRPDLVYYQDDWGSKQNLFLPPDVWRDMIKPLHTRIVEAAHSANMVFVHHADCICQPVVKDMVEMGIDAWQGVIPQNDIVEIQRDTEGKLPMVGGIDTPALVSCNATEEKVRYEVRRAIDTYCPGGRFYPSMPTKSGFSAELCGIIRDELDSYGRQWAQEHPVN